MSWIKQSQEYHEEETHEKNYIIDDVDLDMEKILENDEWMF